MPLYCSTALVLRCSGVTDAVGTAHVASPRQKVVAPALVPLLRLVTGRLPVTSAVSDTAPKVGAPAALPCKTVVVVPREPNGVGVAPAPPPRTSALAIRATEEAAVPAAVKPKMPPDVPEVSPVPPCATDAAPVRVCAAFHSLEPTSEVPSSAVTTTAAWVIANVIAY